MKITALLVNTFVQFCSSERKDGVRNELILVEIEVNTVVDKIATIIDPIVQILTSFQNLIL